MAKDKWCLFCSELFDTDIELLNHVMIKHQIIGPKEMQYANHNPKCRDIPCKFCDKVLKNTTDLKHHLEFNHFIGKEFKQMQSDALFSQKNWYKKEHKDTDITVTCPECFTVLDNVDELIKHGQDVHQAHMIPEVVLGLQKKLKNIKSGKPDNCEKCGLLHYGIVATKIDSNTLFICFNCYEDYWGTNALHKLVMGVPPEEIQRMRKPIHK